MNRLRHIANAALTQLAVFLICAYRVAWGPLKPWHCKHTPSCSEYALRAFRLHGPWRGLSLATSRLLRCRPGTPGGFDPVPELPVETSHPHTRPRLQSQQETGQRGRQAA